MVAEELDAPAELEGEVEARGIVDRNIARRDEEACISYDKGLESRAWCEVNALAEGAYGWLSRFSPAVRGFSPYC